MSEDEQEEQPESLLTIIQKAGDHAVQIAQNFGTVIVNVAIFRDVRQVVVFLLQVLLGVQILSELCQLHVGLFQPLIVVF